jgi:hypothetical protein
LFGLLFAEKINKLGSHGEYAMAEPVRYTVKNVKPKVVLAKKPYYLVQLETDAGPIDLMFQGQALEYFRWEIENRLKHLGG